MRIARLQSSSDFAWLKNFLVSEVLKEHLPKRMVSKPKDHEQEIGVFLFIEEFMRLCNDSQEIAQRLQIKKSRNNQ